MRDTHIVMPRSTPPASPPSSGLIEPLDRLDDVLGRIRRVLQRPGYRRLLLEGLSTPVELASLRVLRVVQRAGEAPTIGFVADRLAIDPSTASRVVDRAVEARLLERHACTDDRRRARLHLTAAGEQVLDEVTDRHRAMLREITEKWEGDRLASLVVGMEQLADGFDALERSS